MRFDGLIFDLDGTLWDCSEASARAIQQAYDLLAVPRRVTTDFVRSISGKTTAECDLILFEGIDPQILPSLQKHLGEFELAELKLHAPFALYEGVDEGLRQLQKHYRLYLVSNCGEAYLRIFLQDTSAGNLFVDHECFGRTRRPKHENIRSIVNRGGLANPCYIGDTAGDEHAAMVAEVAFVHAGYGFGVPEGDAPSMHSFGALCDYFLDLAI